MKLSDFYFANIKSFMDRNKKIDTECRYYENGSCKYHGKYCNGVCSAWVKKT